jgi:hypothetical protein
LSIDQETRKREFGEANVECRKELPPFVILTSLLAIHYYISYFPSAL